MRALTAEQVAAELGRSKEWLYDNWKQMVRKQKMPKPTIDNGGGLAWSAAQFYAWLDRDLSKEMKAAAAAFRAAFEAYSRHNIAGDNEAAEIDRWKAMLDQRFGAGAH